MAIRQAQDEFSHAPRLFDGSGDNVRSRRSRSTVRRVKLDADIDSHGDGCNGRRRRHQSETWPDTRGSR
jgi:hypothetical protein